MNKVTTASALAALAGLGIAAQAPAADFSYDYVEADLILADAGANAYQLFDSWAGDLAATEYQEWAHRRHQEILQTIRQIPSFLFVKECPYLDLMTKSRAEVVSLGVRHDLAAARQLYPQQVFQGNLSEELLRTGTPEQVAEATQRCVAAGGGRNHIVNLSHGVDRTTPVANFEAYVRAVKR